MPGRGEPASLESVGWLGPCPLSERFPMTDTDNNTRQLFELATAMAHYHAYREGYDNFLKKMAVQNSRPPATEVILLKHSLNLKIVSISCPTSVPASKP